MRRGSVIGFVGSIGCGKSLRSKYLANLTKADGGCEEEHVAAVRARVQKWPEAAFTRIDCDQLGHTVYAPGSSTYHAVVNRFGRGIVDSANSDGTADDKLPPINRRALGAVVFADPAALQDLNAIVWPELTRRAMAEINAAADASECVFVEGALLVELADIARRCDALWFYTADPNVAMKRVSQRDGLDEEAILRRIKAQRPLSERLDAARALPGSRQIKVFDTSNDEVSTARTTAVDALCAFLDQRSV